MAEHITECYESRFKNGVILCADWDQLELRTRAILTQDPMLIQELNSGEDIHSANAREWKKLPSGTPIPDDIRTPAKRIAYMIRYGAWAKRIGEDLGIPLHEAQDFINMYRNKYKREVDHYAKLIQYVKENKTEYKKSIGMKISTAYIQRTTYGKGYTFWTKQSQKGTTYIPTTEILNYENQGLADEILKISLGKLIKIFPPNENQKVLLINTEHDANYFDCYNIDAAKIAAPKIKRIMEDTKSLKKLTGYNIPVELPVKIKVGPNLNTLTPLESMI